MGKPTIYDYLRRVADGNDKLLAELKTLNSSAHAGAADLRTLTVAFPELLQELRELGVKVAELVELLKPPDLPPEVVGIAIEPGTPAPRD